SPFALWLLKARSVAARRTASASARCAVAIAAGTGRLFAARRRRCAATLFRAAENGLAREVDAALRVDLDNLHHDLVADLDHVFDALDALRRELRDVDEAFFARQDRDERTEVHQSRYRAEAGLTNLHRLGQRF